MGKSPLDTSGSMSCSRCLAHTHQRPNCPNSLRCWACSSFGHFAAECSLPPRLVSRSSQIHAPPSSNDHRAQVPMKNVPESPKPRSFLSFADYFYCCTGRCPPTLTVIPWLRSWSIKAPEFVVDNDEVEDGLPPLPQVTVTSSSPPATNSFENNGVQAS